MKHILLCLLLFISGYLSAQDVIKFRPQSACFKNIAVGYEHFLSPTFSLQLNGSFMPYQKLRNPYISLSYGEFRDIIRKPVIYGTVFSLTPEARFYDSPKETQEQRLYIAIYLRYYHCFFQAKGGGELNDMVSGIANQYYQYSGKGQRFAIRPGLQVGEVYSFSKHFKLELFAGLNMGLLCSRMETTFFNVNNMTEAEILAYSTNISAAFYTGRAKPLQNGNILIARQGVSVALRCGVDIAYQF